MKFKILLMAVVLAGLLFSLCASAATTDPSCGEVPIRQLNYVDATSVNKFDSSLGELQSVTVTVDACGYATRVLTNEDPIPTGVDYSAILTAAMTSTIPGIGNQVFQIATTDDFHLGLGETHTIEIGSQAVPECDNQVFVLTTPAELAPYIGNAGDTVSIPVSTSSNIQVTGSTEWSSQGSTFMGIRVCVVYEYQPPLCINGTKTNDCTGEGIPGWEICLTNPADQTVCTTTDANGDFSFCGLAPGVYEVCEEIRDGWTPLDAVCRDVTLDEVSVEDVNFVNEPLVCISGHKFDSRTDAGLTGWTIQLKDANGDVIKTAMTGTGGLYEFCGLPSGSYTVCEVQKAGWKAVGDTCIPVVLEGCENSEDNDFFNEPTNLVCVCPFFIKNELYTASCKAIYEVDAEHGVLANDPAGSIVTNPGIIQTQYGTITLDDSGAFEYDPTTATAPIHNGVYVIFNYSANNGLCDSRYLGIAKIQVSCK